MGHRNLGLCSLKYANHVCLVSVINYRIAATTPFHPLWRHSCSLFHSTITNAPPPLSALHALSIKNASLQTLNSANHLLNLYAKSNNMGNAQKLFDEIPQKNTQTWTILISGFARAGSSQVVFNLFREMQTKGASPNQYTLSSVFKCCSLDNNLQLGKGIHAWMLRNGVDVDVALGNSILDLYLRCKVFEYAERLFENLPYKDVVRIVSWGSMVSGYVWNGMYEDCLKIFKLMVRELVVVDIRTVTTVISACANVGILEFGRHIHAYIQKIGHRIDAYVGSSLIDMYSKSGSLDDAWMVFRQINEPNVVLWTSMISGCALHGQGRQAIGLFEEMLKQGIIPNEITFLGVLSACSHAGLLEEGFRYFSMMKDAYHINPGVEHCTSMVDLYGRAGRLMETKNFIFENDISHLTSVWKSFLSSCRLHRNVEMGKWVSEMLLQVAPSDPEAYILLSNMCASNHRWDEAARVRSLMHQRGVKKQPGQSWIQIKDQIHTFVMGDRSHPQDKEIYSYLDVLIGRLKEIGYSLEVKLVMQDVEEEQGEVLISHHSEKLAVVFGIINTANRSPIRIIKNLRICTDCHSFIKNASQLLDREIIVRDIHRFHHFKHGSCSCGDYW
uniref:Pentatricopeptide repeat-containing protein At3g23330 family n=1 Tax=Cajanus cajan TaxID=3821 RepID=A0A151TAU9_CAJCA|nr:Putative pentatricopeptide repeat-containing protein At3g23330 family [Cajanus cajan]